MGVNMAEVEVEFGKSSSSLLLPSSGTTSQEEEIDSSAMMRGGGGPLVSPCPLESQPPPLNLLKGEPMDSDEDPRLPHLQDTLPEEEDSCPSEEDTEKGNEDGRLEIVLNEKRLDFERHGQQMTQSERPFAAMHSKQQQPLSDVDEEEEHDEEEQRQTTFEIQRKRLELQRALREPFGNLTVTKFPINGHQHQHQQQHFLPRHTGVSGDNFNTTLLKQNVRSRTLLDKQQFQFLSLTPQTSPNQNDPFHNNNNNSLTLNNNKEALLKAHSQPQVKGHHGLGLKQELPPERQSQRRNHYGHFVNHHHHHQQQQLLGQGQETTYGHPQTGGKDDRKTGNNSPNPTDLKPDCLGVGGGGLNLLSRSIGTALLNLASLGSLASFQQPQNLTVTAANGNSPTPSTAAPLNLTNNNGASGLTNTSTATSLANSFLAQYMSTHHNQSTNQRSPSPSGSFSSPNNLPQLILASGNIVQGIQGAQLLIPSAQGLMTQTVLTIPITQPLSPTSLLSNAHSPPGRKTHPGHPGHAHSKSASSSPSTGRPSTTRSPSPVTDFSLPHNTPQSHSQQSSQGHIPLISEKLAGLDRGLHPLSIRGSGGSGSLNGFRMSSAQGRRESSTSGSGLISASLNLNQGSSHFGPSQPHPHPHMSICPPSKLSPCSSQSHEHGDSCDFLDPSDNDDDDNTMMDGINLDEIKEFAKAFKLRRLSLGLTQTQVGQALSVTEGPAYSQSAICRALAWQLAQSESEATIPQHQAIFEKLDITPKSAQKIKPVLENWMKEAEDRYRTGNQNLNEFVGMEPSKKRKRRTSFTPQALEILNTHFERNTHPSGAEITTLAHQLGYEREVIRIWFCNKRQALKNTVRMMSKSGSPI